ncbi:MAG: hypothetical protein DMF97_11955 [Acidobacteria bacterium]|nr:MAG: hypothetical protein DMF97_11955 [Acidobacteriota bacterium]
MIVGLHPTCTRRTVDPLMRSSRRSAGVRGADCAPWGGSSGRIAALGATLDFNHGLRHEVLYRICDPGIAPPSSSARPLAPPFLVETAPADEKGKL